MRCIIIPLLVISCSGATYECITQECKFDLKVTTNSTYIDPFIITRNMAETQTQVSSYVTQTVNTTLGVLQIITNPSSPNPVGAFVGGGTGNKAILQLNQFHLLKLSDLTYVDIEYKINFAGGANVPYLNFTIDLDCILDEDVNVLTLAQIRSRRRIIVLHSLFSTQVGPDADGFKVYSATQATAAWAIVGTPTLGMAQNPSSYGTLSSFDFSSYPQACIINGVSGDGGLPRNLSNPACVTGAGLPGTASADCGKSMAGIFVNMGDSTNLVNYDIYIKRIRINSNTVSFKENY